MPQQAYYALGNGDVVPCEVVSTNDNGTVDVLLASVNSDGIQHKASGVALAGPDRSSGVYYDEPLDVEPSARVEETVPPAATNEPPAVDESPDETPNVESTDGTHTTEQP